MKILIMLTLLLIAHIAWARAADSTFMATISPITIDGERKFISELYYKLPFTVPENSRHIVRMTCYDITDGQDSVLVYAVTDHSKTKPRQGMYHRRIPLSSKAASTPLTPLYKDILRKNGTLPAGKYYTEFSLQVDSFTLSKSFIQEIDSALAIHSDAREELNTLYQPAPEKGLLRVFKDNKALSTTRNTSAILKSSVRKIDRAFQKKGFQVSYRPAGATTFVDVYCRSRFVGYYKINMEEPLKDQINRQKENFRDHITGGINNELESSRNIFSQIKKLSKQQDKNKEVSGTISVMGSMSSGQEEYAEQDNNYYEVMGQVEVPIMNIPVNVEGYYTSQDKNRKIKASYFRIHYDTEQAKSELLKLIADYKNKYRETAAKGKGLGSVYGTYLDKLKSEQTGLLRQLEKEAGISDIKNIKTDTTGLMDKLNAVYQEKKNTATDAAQDSLQDISPTISKAKNTADRVKRLYERAIRTYEKIEATRQKIEKYQALLEQYENNRYFDSLIAYDQLKNIEDGSADDKTYKELVKSASGLLPEGSAKKFITGLTHLDAGIISKEISGYTLGGQTMKGLDVGYDLGFCETGFTYGRVEYVSRDGSIDKYSGYSARASFKPAKAQKATLIYYGYMPSRKMLNETDFFKDVEIHMPTFKQPIHIVSLVYSGKIGKYLSYEAEGATSYRKTEEFQDVQNNGSQSGSLHDKLAYKLELAGSIPKTAIDLTGGYEHVGKNFENNSLPMNFSGTDRYHIGGRSSFFKNFLSVGVTYNVMQQKSMAVKSTHAKWGFDIATHSKRFPSVSLSYKPFSTYRSLSDTFSIPQKPILGEVWLGKLSYQIKKQDYILRLTAVYNKNTSLMDTIESGSNTGQFNALFTRSKLNLMMNLGFTKAEASYLSEAHSHTKFLSLSGGYMVHPQWHVNLAQSLGLSGFGMSRYATNAGVGYRMKKTPLMIRWQFRYNSYRMQENQDWKKLYGGTLDITWNFRFKLNERI